MIVVRVISRPVVNVLARIVIDSREISNRTICGRIFSEPELAGSRPWRCPLH